MTEILQQSLLIDQPTTIEPTTIEPSSPVDLPRKRGRPRMYTEQQAKDNNRMYVTRWIQHNLTMQTYICDSCRHVFCSKNALVIHLKTPIHFRRLAYVKPP